MKGTTLVNIIFHEKVSFFNNSMLARRFLSLLFEGKSQRYLWSLPYLFVIFITFSENIEKNQGKNFKKAGVVTQSKKYKRPKNHPLWYKSLQTKQISLFQKTNEYCRQKHDLLPDSVLSVCVLRHLLSVAVVLVEEFKETLNSTLSPASALHCKYADTKTYLFI